MMMVVVMMGVQMTRKVAGGVVSMYGWHMTTTGVLAMLRDTRHECMSDVLLSKAETARGGGLDDDSEGVYTLRRRGGVEFKALVCGQRTSSPGSSMPIADAICPR
jgi:hypothetical protein